MNGKATKLKRWLKPLVAGALIYWLIERGHLQVEQLAVVFHPAWFPMCLLLVALSLFLSHWRWVILLKAQGFNNQLIGTLPLSFIGWFFNFVIPGGVGGDLMKAYYIVQDNPHRRMAAATTVVMDRVIGLYAMLALAISSFFWDVRLVMENKAVLSVAMTLVAGFVASSLMLLAAMSKSIYQHKLTNQILAMIPARQVVQKVYDAVHSYRHSMMTLVKTFFLSIAAQLASVAFFVVVGSALNFNIPLAAYFFAVPVGFIVSSVPLAPAGIGVGQVAFLFLFKIYIGPEQASIGPTGVTVYQAVLLLWSLIGAYFYAQRNRPVLEEVSS